VDIAIQDKMSKVEGAQVSALEDKVSELEDKVSEGGSSLLLVSESVRFPPE
jgi:hypothetical protein